MMENSIHKLIESLGMVEASIHKVIEILSMMKTSIHKETHKAQTAKVWSKELLHIN